ncbi:glycosyltransferase family 8 protein [Mesorhizobium sp. ES1-1]|uniref:glycosyltransferase family 8 protein n=1 Tax=Mesorhizobium sp. ES1-1 TaxID=2876629 RepID=UPI001CC922FF|nr:glycosyltransferase [Mesorhizobium sp. ES1-1]MBZ9678789.1 hypothetical protein [Mesorhizobium sp. ES1-1]
MIIACATDERYAELAAVLLRSIAENADLPGTRVYLVGDGLGSRTRDWLAASAAGLDYRFIDLDAIRADISGLPVSLYSTAIHIRLLLPRLIPESGRALYLDSDTMITGSLRPLRELDLGDALAAAVADAGRAAEFSARRLDRPADAPYFNSGVLLFDIGVWRQAGLGDACVRTAASRNDLWPDQDAINLTLDGRILALDRKWNFWSQEPLPRGAFEDARIVHFIPDKPLFPACRHPLLEDFLALRATTPWRDIALKGSERERRLEMFRQAAIQTVRRRKGDEP